MNERQEETFVLKIRVSAMCEVFILALGHTPFRTVRVVLISAGNYLHAISRDIPK